ncbi:MAG: rRNA maturation RNase YbeY [Chthoniobacterales bacterium]
MIRVLNRQRRVPVDSLALETFAQSALSQCLKLGQRKSGVLKELTEISVILVSDRRIAEIHKQFMNEAGPTDVITFQHGDIVISAETAKRQARQFGTTVAHELRLYVVHGLLHLCGFDDKTSAGAAEMKRVQDRIVRSLS